MHAQEDLFDLSHLHDPVSADAPVGRDLDGTLALDALEDAAREPDEPSIQGVERVDARDWRAIEADARALLATSKDLRIAVILCRALSEQHGSAGFAAGVGLLGGLVARHWAGLYPRPDDDGDPTIRLNGLKELVSPAQVAALRRAEVASAPALGRFSVNDVLVASDSPAGRPGSEPPPRAHVLAAVESLGGAGVTVQLGHVRHARDALHRIVTDVERETGKALALTDLIAPRGERRPGLLDALESVLAAHAERLAPRTDDVAHGVAVDGTATPAPARGEGAIRHREDVLRAIDVLVDYYARAEPSSPVPLLLKRARRLATMDFMQIIEDLAQAGMPQVHAVAGSAAPSE
ncbi:MAG: type VI secretion system protein TssA [Polyangiales bacterium]